MIRRISILLFCCGLLFAGPAQALFSVLGFKNSMIDFLLDQLSTEGEFEITAEQVEEPEEGITSIKGLKIADGEGVWLTAEQLYFSWNPSRLLSGEVEFSDLSMTGVAVLRRPVIPPGQETDALDAATPEVDDGAFEWPRSPLTLRIDRIALERVRIAQEVLGHAIAFDAIGAARDEGDIQSAKLDLKRTDAVQGTISFDYARRFSDNTLAVNLSAAEAANGLVANLADLPRDAPSEVTLRADGPPTDWRVTFGLALAETLWADGTAAVSYEGPLRVDAEFSARPGARMAPEIANLLGAEAEIVVKASEGADGTILIEQGRVTSPDLNLSASGTFSRTTGAADLAVELDAGARLAKPFDSVDFGGLTFVGTVRGAPGTFAADGDLVMDGLATAAVDVRRAELIVDVRQTSPSASTTGTEARPSTTELTIEGLARGLRLDRVPASVIGDADTQIIATLTGEKLDLETAWLDSKILQLSASGTADLASQNATLGFGLSTPDLATVAGPYGVDASGQIDLSGDLQRLHGVIALDYEATLHDFSHPVAEARALALNGSAHAGATEISFETKGEAQSLRLDRIGPDLLPTAIMQVDGSLKGDELNLRELSLDSPLLDATLRGNLDLKDQSGTVEYSVGTPDLGPVARLYNAPASGALSADGSARLDGPTSPPQLAGTLSVSGLTWDGAGYGQIVLEHDVIVSESPSGTLHATNRGGPFGDAQVKTGFSYQQPLLALTGLDATALGIRSSGDLTLNQTGPFAEGALTLMTRDLRGISRLAGTALSGSAKGSVRLNAPDGRQNVNLDLRTNRLETAGIRFGSARVQGAITNLLGNPAVQLAADATAIAVNQVELNTATLRANGPLSGLGLSIETAGRTVKDEPVSLSAAAQARIKGSTIHADVTRFTAGIGSDQVSLNQPLRLSTRGASVALEGIDASLPDGGQLQGQIASFGGPLAGKLNLNAPRLGFLRRLAGIPLERGSLTLSAEFDTRASRARADVMFKGRDLRFEGTDAAGSLGLDARLGLRGTRAEIEGEVSGGFGQPLRVSAGLPIRLSQGLPSLARRGPVAGTLDWTGEIGDLWALVPAPGSVLTGNTVVDLSVTGDISAPKITGSARVTDGGFQQADLGTILTDLELATTLTPGGDLGLKLMASDGAKGSVTLNGRFALDASGVDLRTHISHAVLVRRDDVTARLDGEVSASGPLTDLAVTGKLQIEDAEVRLINNNPPSIVTLGEVLIKGQPEPGPVDANGGVRLDLSVDAPGRIFVRGRGLESEWRLGLRAQGTARAPILTGRIEKKRGALDLIGKSFELTRGRIDFDGGAEIDPRIDIALERQTSDLTGRILVGGYASDPQLSFASTPALPEDEVLPRTLFGKSSQALTGSQAIQLALGIATLMDGGGGTLDQVRGAVGLDSLRVEQDEEGNASVAIGKEVAEGVWVGSKQSLGSGGSSVAVEIEVFDDVLLDAEIEQGGGSSVGVQWKKDF